MIGSTAFEGTSARAKRWAALLNLGIWSLWLLVYQVPFWFPVKPSTLELSLSLTTMTAGLTACWLWLRLTLRWQRQGHPPKRAIALSGITLLALIALSSLLMAALRSTFVENMLPAKGGDGVMRMPMTIVALDSWLGLAWVFILFAGGSILIFSLIDAAERDRRFRRALAAARQAQLATLNLQVSPHFLFNALNAVSELISEDRRREAGLAVARLTELFRAALAEAPSELARLEEEFDLVAAYLAIEKTRFDERLRVEIDLPPDLADALAPRFVLQPLVENAGKYAVAPAKRPVTVTVRAGQENGILILTVEDDGPGPGPFDRRGLGLGLRNVAARLEALYGSRAELAAGPTGSGFLARVELPLQPAGRSRVAA